MRIFLERGTAYFFKMIYFALFIKNFALDPDSSKSLGSGPKFTKKPRSGFVTLF
jgi:hypothetical protein